MKRMVWAAAFILALGQQAHAAADLEEKDPAQEIIYRANLGRAPDVLLLVSKGVSPDQVDDKGTPLLSLAISRKDKEGMKVVQALLDAGADINAKDAAGQNALFYAVRLNDLDKIQFLLDHGINYYAPDNEGTIPRTLAFNLGYKEALETMDKFVTAQTDKVNEQYKEYNRQIEEQNKLIEKQAREAVEEAERKSKEQAEQVIKDQAEAAARQKEVAKKAEEETAKTGTAKETEKPQTESEDYLETLAPKEAPKEVPKAGASTTTTTDLNSLAEKRQSPEFENDMRNYAFQNCAFQYWSYCRQIKQRTDLSPEELRVAIDTHREQVLEIMKKAMGEYQLKQDYVDTVSKNAMQRIHDELDEMPSKTYRFEHSVCMMPDVQTRCTEIAETWNMVPPEKKPAETVVPSSNSFQGGIGSSGADGMGSRTGNMGGRLTPHQR